jgi:tRNA A37 threonylcarbamoyladenosine dehydratase
MEMSDWNTRFGNFASLLTSEEVERLSQLKIAVIGLGGVGSWCVETLVRSGVRYLTLVDLDDICYSNFNRQVHAINDNVGELKVEKLSERMKAINPSIDIQEHISFFSRDRQGMLGEDLDGIIDAIDGVRSKCELINWARVRNKKVVTIGAAGGKFNPTDIQINDLTKTYNDNLLRRIRKKLKQEYDFPKNSRWGINSVFSIEKVTLPREQACIDSQAGQGMRNCQNGGLGSAMHITAIMGMMAAYTILKDLGIQGIKSN